MLFEEYSELPDYMTTEELEKFFVKLINYAQEANDVYDESIAEALSELSDRQWHTYKLLNYIIKERIEEWINKAWDIRSPELIDSITSVIGHLGLTKSFELVKKSINEDNSDEVKEILETTIKELKGHISDPYFER